MLRAKPARLDAVLYTHEHADHTAGIDDIRPFNAMQQGDMPIYALARVIDNLKQRFAYIFGEKRYPGLPGVCAHSFADEAFEVNGVRIQPVPVQHGKLRISGFRIENVAYLTDVKSLETGALRQLRDLDVLIISALRREKAHHAHALLHEALSYIDELKPKRSFITHLSHEMGLHEEVGKILPKGVWLAYDGLKIEA